MTKKNKIHFEISERKILLRFFDIFFVLLFLQAIGYIFQFDYFTITRTNFYWTILLSIYLLFFGTIFEMYNLQIASNQFTIIRSIILTTTATVLFYLLTPWLTPSLPNNRLQILLFYSAILMSLLIWRIVYLKFFSSTRFFKNVILICEYNSLITLIKDLKSNDPNFKIIAHLNSNSSISEPIQHKKVKTISLQNIDEFIQKSKVSEIVIANSNHQNLDTAIYQKLIKLIEKGIIIRDYIKVYESITQQIPIQHISNDFYKYFPFSRSNNNRLYKIIVRFFDILFSILGIVIGTTILPLILIGNAISNQGKLFYTQERVGKHGKIFTIYKLRSMIKNAEANGAVFATQNDVRITKFGKFLRKSRLDEVPQFINVIKGEMAIIGPRPERPIFVNQIAKKMPYYETRHIIKPGLTGWAQVNYSYGETYDDSIKKLQYDLFYIKHRSVFLDINILIKTISTILFYRGQ